MARQDKLVLRVHAFFDEVFVMSATHLFYMRDQGGRFLGNYEQIPIRVEVPKFESVDKPMNLGISFSVMPNQRCFRPAAYYIKFERRDTREFQAIWIPDGLFDSEAWLLGEESL